jgi:hypothetical protein
MNKVPRIIRRIPKIVGDFDRGVALYRKLKQAPIVIGGCERSGTTLLHRALAAHPNILAIPEETWSLCHSAEAGFGGNRPIRLEHLWYSLGKIPPSHYEGKLPERWSEKSPCNIYYFDQIRERFDNNVKLIQIVRDGRDVVTSIHKTIKSHAPLVPVERWVASVRAGLKYLEDSSVLTLRYEDLVKNFHRETERVCNFLGYPLVPREVERWQDYTPIKHHHSGPIKPITTDSIGKWGKIGEWSNKVEELMMDDGAVELLKRYSYLSD